MGRFDERLVSFTQAGKGLPTGVTEDTSKRGAVKKAAKYRFITTGTALYMRFGNASVTCAADGTQGYLLQPNVEYYFAVPDQQEPGITHIAFSRAIVVATDNFIEVR